MADESKSKSIRDVLRTVFRRRWLFLATSALVAILALILTLTLLPLKYTSESVLEVLNKEMMAIGGRNDSAYSRIRQTAKIWMSSKPQMEKALEQCGVFDRLPRSDKNELTEEGLRQKQDLIAQHTANLQVLTQVKTDTVDRYVIRFTSADPLLAQRMPNQLMFNFTPLLKNEIVNQLTSQKEHLDRLVDKGNTEVDLAKQERRKFEEDNQGPPPSDIWYIDTQVKALKNEKQEREADLTMATTKLEGYKAKLRNFQASEKDGDAKEEVKVMGPNPKRAELVDQLAQTQEGLVILTEVQKKTEKHPDVIAQRERIVLLEKRIDAEPLEIEIERHVYSARNGKLDPTFYLDMKAEELNIERLHREIKQRDGDLSRLEYQRSRYNQLSREYGMLVQKQENAIKKLATLQAELDKVDQNLRDEKANRRTDILNRQVAELPQRPSSPKFLMIVGMAIGAGLAAGSAIVFLAFKLDRTIATPEEATEYFNLPVHGVIAEIVTPSVKQRRRLVRIIVIPVASIVLACGITLGLVSNYLRLNRPSEYRQLRAAPTLYLSEKVITPIADLFR